MSGRTFVDVALTTPHIRNMYVFRNPHTMNKSVQVRLYRSDCDLCLYQRKHTNTPRRNRRLFQPTDLHGFVKGTRSSEDRCPGRNVWDTIQKRHVGFVTRGPFDRNLKIWLKEWASVRSEFATWKTRIAFWDSIYLNQKRMLYATYFPMTRSLRLVAVTKHATVVRS